MSPSPLADARSLAAFRRALLTWFRWSARDLPWRRTRDPYRIWVSETLLQQTRVETGLPYYQRFLMAFPTLQTLADASLDQVLQVWQGLGYYARASHLHQAARVLVQNRDGRLPQTAEQWRQLPGVGRYTAAAIASMALDEPVPAVDGNAKRVLARLFGVRTRIDAARTQNRLWRMADALLSRSSPGQFNQALMELGSRVCLPKRPACSLCPVRKWCAAFAAGLQHELPHRRARPAPQSVEAVVGVLRRNGRYLLMKRPPVGLLGGLWEFPGGPIGPGERPRAALVRRLKESLRIDVSVGQQLANVSHAFSHRALRLHVFECRFLEGLPRLGNQSETRWIARSHLGNYALSRLTRKVLERIRST